MNLRDRILRTLVAVENRLDAGRFHLRSRVRHNRRIEVVPYVGYGNSERIWLPARVLDATSPRPSTATDSAWHNLVAILRRAFTREVPYAVLRATFYDVSVITTANEEGFALQELPSSPNRPQDEPWHPLTLELIEPATGVGLPVRASGRVLIPPPGTEIGVISDIDDTVVHSGAAHWPSMLRTVLLGNAHTRLPLEGVADFYQALQHDHGGSLPCPIFYVSNGPWNLYDLVSEFMALNDIPIGPITMRDWGLTDRGLWPTRPRQHKLEAISRVLEMYPKMRFILVGDSGEADPEIYHEVASAFPGRIAAIYIRAVRKHQSPMTGKASLRVQAMRNLVAPLEALGTDLVLGDSTIPFAEHAAGRGWIAREAIAKIRAHVLTEAPPDA